MNHFKCANFAVYPFSYLGPSTLYDLHILSLPPDNLFIQIVKIFSVLVVVLRDALHQSNVCLGWRDEGGNRVRDRDRFDGTKQSQIHCNLFEQLSGKSKMQTASEEDVCQKGESVYKGMGGGPLSVD